MASPLVQHQHLDLAQERSLRAAPRPFAIVQSLQYLVYTAGAVATIGPVVWIVLLSFKTRREFSNDPFALPEHFTFDNYVQVFQQDDVLVFLTNSLITVASALAIVLVASTLAAYAIARIAFRGRNLLFMMFLIGDSIPLIIIVIPLFVLVDRIGLSGSRLSIILPYAAMNMGLSIYILRAFFRSIGSDIEDAARLDGCSLLQTIWYVILPMARPGLIVVAVINFISFWNEYFLATVLASSQSLFTLPAGLAATFVNKHDTNWPVMSAAVVLTLIPVIVLFSLAQDKIARGWTVSPR
jgi:ABC-type glycerol-3-phosphate transport system permease component